MLKAVKMSAVMTQETKITSDSENVIKTTQKRVSCNGGGGALGHPAIYLNMGTDGQVVCPYCSARFVLETK